MALSGVSWYLYLVLVPVPNRIYVRAIVPQSVLVPLA